jgi:hypothetical protein
MIFSISHGVGYMLPAFADESVTVWCYRDVRSSSVGSVVAYHVAEAAEACNSMLYDCSGSIGCCHDFDYLDDVCVNIQGNTFLK